MAEAPGAEEERTEGEGIRNVAKHNHSAIGGGLVSKGDDLRLFDKDDEAEARSGEVEAEGASTDAGRSGGEATRSADEEEVASPWVTFEATAYIAMCSSGCIGITATGLDVRESIKSPQGHRIVAVDPNVIPLGSLLEIDVNGRKITAKAEDTGGAIKGNRIDLLVGSETEALEFGRQDVEVRILE